MPVEKGKILAYQFAQQIHHLWTLKNRGKPG
jgi:hypothetical protein